MHGRDQRDPAHSRTVPRLSVMRNLDPSSALAAVAPNVATTAGRTSRSSASSHGRQARTCATAGVLWMRREPRRSNRKCFTAFVT